MTAMTQEEMVAGARTVAAGLEALRAEHAQLLAGLASNTEHEHEKASLVRKSIDAIELGLGEAQVMMALASHLQSVEAEKQKLRTQVRRLCQENAWLRDELAAAQQHLQASEQRVAQLEEENKHLDFMASIRKYDSDITEDSDNNRSGQSEKKRDDPMVDLFPDDDHEDNRNNKFDFIESTDDSTGGGDDPTPSTSSSVGQYNRLQVNQSTQQPQSSANQVQQILAPRTRMRWSVELNEGVMRSYYRVTLGRNETRYYRRRMRNDFISRFPELSHLSEQRIADQRRAIVNGEYINTDRLNALKLEVSRELERDDDSDSSSSS